MNSRKIPQKCDQIETLMVCHRFPPIFTFSKSRLCHYLQILETFKTSRAPRARSLAVKLTRAHTSSWGDCCSTSWLAIEDELMFCHGEFGRPGTYLVPEFFDWGHGSEWRRPRGRCLLHLRRGALHPRRIEWPGRWVIVNNLHPKSCCALADINIRYEAVGDFILPDWLCVNVFSGTLSVTLWYIEWTVACHVRI